MAAPNRQRRDAPDSRIRAATAWAASGRGPRRAASRHTAWRRHGKTPRSGRSERCRAVSATMMRARMAQLLPTYAGRMVAGIPEGRLEGVGMAVVLSPGRQRIIPWSSPDVTAQQPPCSTTHPRVGRRYTMIQRHHPAKPFRCTADWDRDRSGTMTCQPHPACRDPHSCAVPRRWRARSARTFNAQAFPRRLRMSHLSRELNVAAATARNGRCCPPRRPTTPRFVMGSLSRPVARRFARRQRPGSRERPTTARRRLP